MSALDLTPELKGLLEQCDRDLRHARAIKDEEDIDTLLDFRLMIMDAGKGVPQDAQ